MELDRFDLHERDRYDGCGLVSATNFPGTTRAGGLTGRPFFYSGWLNYCAASLAACTSAAVSASSTVFSAVGCGIEMML